MIKKVVALWIYESLTLMTNCSNEILLMSLRTLSNTTDECYNELVLRKECDVQYNGIKFHETMTYNFYLYIYINIGDNN